MPQPRKPRLYSLFHKIDGRWVRQSSLAFRKGSAVRIFQNALLSASFAGIDVALRPVKAEIAPETPPAPSAFRPAAVSRQNRAEAAETLTAPPSVS